MKRLITAIVRALKAATSLTSKTADALGELAMTPLKVAQSLLGGGGGAGRLPPEFDPEVSALDLLDKMAKPAEEPRVTQISQLDRDGIQTVAAYTSALPGARKSFDLSGLKKELRATLLTMSDGQLAALSRARLHEVRKFVSGEEHGIPSVPIVGKPTMRVPRQLRENGETSVSPEELMERVQAALRDRKGGSKPFVMPRLP